MNKRYLIAQAKKRYQQGCGDADGGFCDHGYLCEGCKLIVDCAVKYAGLDLVKLEASTVIMHAREQRKREERRRKQKFSKAEMNATQAMLRGAEDNLVLDRWSTLPELPKPDGKVIKFRRVSKLNDK